MPENSKTMFYNETNGDNNNNWTWMLGSEMLGYFCFVLKKAWLSLICCYERNDDLLSC